MLLTFTPESIEKIQRGQKYSTIRRGSRWWVWFTSPHRKKGGFPLHVWEGNPRNGGRFVAESYCTLVYLLPGDGFSIQEARADGFDSVEALVARLAELHGMTEQEVQRRARTWSYLEFNPRPIAEAA